MPELFKIATAYKKRTTGGGGGDTTAPTVTWSIVDENTIQGAFSEPVTPSLLGYSFTKDGGALSLDAVTHTTGNNWNFSVAPMTGDNEIRVNYNPAIGDTVDDNANELATITNVLITNDLPPEVPFDLAGATHKTVKYGGTAGVDCDYESLKDAYNGLRAFNTPGADIICDINDGDHTDEGELDTIYKGLYMRHNIHARGASRAGTIIRGAQAASSGNEASVDTFHIPATCLVERMTILGHNCKYCMHNDYNSGNYEYELYVRDCTLLHDSSVVQPSIDVGCGMYGNQKVVYIDCELQGSEGFYAHGIQDASLRDLLKSFEVRLIRCTMNKLEWHDFLENAPNKLVLIDCAIGELILNAYAVTYDANPGDPVANDGTKRFITIEASGNTITTVTRNAEAASILGSAFSSPSDFL